jgi:hypothetical protein
VSFRLSDPPVDQIPYNWWKEPSFLVQVQRKPVQVEIVSQGAVRWRQTVNLGADSPDVLAVPVIFDDKDFNAPDDPRIALSMADTARTVDEYGGNAASYYALAAQYATALDPLADTTGFIKRAYQIEPSNLTYRLAVSKGSLHDAGVEEWKVKSTPEREGIIRQVESLGAFASAVQLRQISASVESDADTREFQSFRAAVLAQATGDVQVNQDESSKVLRNSRLTLTQRRLLTAVGELRPTEVRESLRVLPKDEVAWKATRIEPNAASLEERVRPQIAP